MRFLRILMAGFPVLALAATPPAPAEGVYRLMHQAAEERRRGDFTAAAETYRQVLRTAPDFYEAHLFLGDTLHRLRQVPEAETELEAARRIRPSDALPYAGLAELKRERFRFTEALAILDEAAAAVPAEKREPVLVARGTTLRQWGKAGDAIVLLQEAAQRFPDSPRVREALARSLEARGRVTEAAAAWGQAVERDPDNPALKIGLEEARELSGRLEAAEAVARSRPEDAGAWAELAHRRFGARQDAAAIEAAMTALKWAPGRSDLLLLRALARERSGQPKEAESDLRKIPPSASEHLLALYHRAFLARQRGDDRDEQKIWSEAARSHPEDPAARLMLVLSWKRTGSLRSRLEDLRRQAGSSPPRPADLALLALALEEAGEGEPAAVACARLVLANPLDPDPPVWLSSLLSRQPELLRRWIQEGSVPGGAETGEADRRLFRSRLLRIAGRQEAADSELRDAMLRFPERPEIPLLLAVDGQPPGVGENESRRLIDVALDLDSASPWAHLISGLALLRAGDGVGAAAEAQKVVDRAPDLPEGHQLLGSARRLAGDHPGAVAALTRSLQLDPSDTPGVVRFQLALSLAALGDRHAAREALEGELPQFPELIYRTAWSFADRNFLDRSFRTPDWIAARDRAPDPRTEPAQAYAAVADLLSSLKDPYTRLRGVEETEARYLRARSEKLETDKTGSPVPTSRSVISEDLGANLGYLRLTSFSDPSAREAIRKALMEMAERDGLVLDLRGNTGGLAADADAIAGMLLDSEAEIGRERTRAGEQPQHLPQSRPVLSRKPLVVLTDHRTGSAAEKLASGLQGAGRATVVGETTFGKGVGQMSRLLPGGGMVLVTAVESLSRAGVPIQGRGVLPDVMEEEDPLEKAKEILKRPTP